MSNTIFIVLAFALQPHPPVIVAVMPDPADPTLCALEYEDGWSSGFAGVDPLDAVAIRGSTTPPASDLDSWFENVAVDLEVEGGIPTPGLPDRHQGDPPGLSHTIRLTGLPTGTMLYIAVKGYLSDEGLPIPMLAPAGWASFATASEPGPPDPDGDPAGGCSGTSAGGIGCAMILAAGLLFASRRPG